MPMPYLPPEHTPGWVPAGPSVYLSGPMTDLPALNFPAFFAEADRLAALGYRVTNPAEINGPRATWCQCLRADLRAMLTCHTLALLPGWERSAGAQLELHVAHRVGMTITMAAAITQRCAPAQAAA